MSDNVNHPKHYTSHPSGVECIVFSRRMSFDLGNAFKYLWRCSLKNGKEDVQKACWYLHDYLEDYSEQIWPKDMGSEHALWVRVVNASDPNSAIFKAMQYIWEAHVFKSRDMIWRAYIEVRNMTTKDLQNG
jgi:hypothetical protein